ncbi:MAG: hypothetical protein AAFZ52_06285 [Bacteroidota bacterium]
MQHLFLRPVVEYVMVLVQTTALRKDLIPTFPPNQTYANVPVLLLLLGYFSPRVMIVILYFFTSWWKSAFDSVLWPVLGFFFLPLTVLWYGISETYFSGSVQTVGLVIAVLLDLGLIGRGAKRK